MTQEEAIQRYGPVSHGMWINEAQHCGLLKIPEDIAANWTNSATRQPTFAIYCNKDIHGPLLSALLAVRERGLLKQLKTFDGCFSVRPIRGHQDRLSAHCFAAAIDINAATNRLGTVGENSDELSACFIEQGFTWGKTFSRMDPMHYSYLGF